jgi:glycosyltransferase involved in cell wall biosynthesis
MSAAGGSACSGESRGNGPPRGGGPPRIVLAQERGGADHFVGVLEATAALGGDGVRGERAMPDEPLRLRPGDVLCVSDTRSFAARYALRAARAAGACCVLLMDGIVEHRNTFANPRSGADFLRPAPVDVVACAGANDAAILRELGNDAVATGLPRLAGVERAPLPAARRALVATALHPCFDDGERAALVGALQRVGAALDDLGVAADWRLTGGLEEVVGCGGGAGATGAATGTSGARANRGEKAGGAGAPELALGALLARSSFVISSPSTLLVEAMLAGRPTAMLFPFEAPQWPRAPVVLDQQTLADRGALRAAIEELAARGAELEARQREALARMHGPGPGARAPAEALADLLIELTQRPRRQALDPTLLDPRRLPPPAPRRTGKVRVVSLVYCVDSPVGGVTVWSRRLARALAERNSRYDMRTLLVVTHPDSMPRQLIDDDGLTHACLLDPMGDRWQLLDTLRAAIERLRPDIILPNYADVCFAAATLARAGGARIVPIAHTDHQSYRDLVGFYDRWEAAAGVSDACMAWLAPLAGRTPESEDTQHCSAHRDGGSTRRPARKIVYGVPVAESPRQPEADGPLQIAYIGRMVESQKRIGDLLGVIDGLERRGVEYELHMVGDGADLAAWRAALARRKPRSGRVVVHGRRTPEEVQRLLRDIDASILVSDYEGTSITMLEAMGAGVVPAVTRVPSGVSEWVRDGDNGIVIEIGDTETMAERLAQLSGDRAELVRLGRRAWETVRGTISIERMAEQYEELFEAAMASPRDERPTDTGLRFIEEWTCRKSWCDDPAGARAWIAQALESQGFERICLGWPAPPRPESSAEWSAAPRRSSSSRLHLPRFDAAILPDGDPRAAELRAHGIGVASAPSLHEHELRRAVRRAAAAGAQRIAIYGLGLHTRRCAGIFVDDLPIVGIIDDDPPAWAAAFGLPVTTAARALAELAPDCIVLSSDRFEREMWERTAPHRAAGVRVVALYGAGDEADARARSALAPAQS